MMDIIKQARAYAADKHGTQKRKYSDQPYFNHLAAVVSTLESAGIIEPTVLIPPERIEPVDHGTRRDAEINIQASVFNVFAAADNLAWVCVIERRVRRTDGSELPETWIGLRRNNRVVRNALPTALRQSIAEFDDWFDMVDNYRHALAHRIPLYIPPFSIDPADAERYANLERRKNQALRTGDLVEHERLRREQNRMEFFRPLAQHSYGEGARPIVFHPQLIANFNTIEDGPENFGCFVRLQQTNSMTDTAVSRPPFTRSGRRALCQSVCSMRSPIHKAR